MTNPLKHHLLSSLTGFSALVILSAAIASPNSLPAAFAGAGSLLAGASIAKEAAAKRENEVAEAERVSTAFTDLYEQYRGIVSPDQLSVLSNIQVTKANAFLEALAEAQNGQRVEMPEGVFFRFPHTEHILDRLTANATAWADSRIEPIMKENSELKQRLLILQSAAMQAAAKQQIPAVAQTPNGTMGDDPWQNLIR
jgi:hypothetical protein